MDRVIFCAAIAISFLFAATGLTQKSKSSEAIACRIDLNNVKHMSDIASNALMHEFHIDEPKVFGFLKTARKNHDDGKSLAVATAKEFGIAEADFLAAIEAYKHVNCTHEGGGESKSEPAGDGTISPFAKDVLFHVVVHELGHALVREFDLPVLGNEETLADTFATHYIVSRMPKARASSILKARISSLMIEAEEVPRNEWTVKGEHNSDARRAYQIAATAIAYDSEAFGSLADLVEMTGSEFRGARDYGSELHRSWRRILKPLWMNDGMKSKEARLAIEDDSMFASALESGDFATELEAVLRSFDWHSQVTLRFASGDGGAGWNRSARTITVYDEYVRRFNAQGEK
ncbi:DUF4344 domain-containing metallopeptidase [Mariniblastus fucicola]|uniref:Uncharacterized protein n=1 Tax=Mariniblastus fucicola TaxID=980251 RepID=A0A5B9PE62_9BACT|nr:DUF4344 domain-containing metallopeptidase [Mariniblastus fucicola]QEG21233.1 hypothetical protein MFFC18_10880 [Mariniblastus fucicola]